MILSLIHLVVSIDDWVQRREELHGGKCNRCRSFRMSDKDVVDYRRMYAKAGPVALVFTESGNGIETLLPNTVVETRNDVCTSLFCMFSSILPCDPGGCV